MGEESVSCVFVSTDLRQTLLLPELYALAAQEPLFLSWIDKPFTLAPRRRGENPWY